MTKPDLKYRVKRRLLYAGGAFLIGVPVTLGAVVVVLLQNVEVMPTWFITAVMLAGSFLWGYLKMQKETWEIENAFVIHMQALKESPPGDEPGG